MVFLFHLHKFNNNPVITAHAHAVRAVKHSDSISKTKQISSKEPVFKVCWNLWKSCVCV